MRKIILALLMLMAMAAVAEAKVTTEVVEYEHDGTVLEGFLAWDDSFDGKRPGVLLVHQWMGLGEHEKAWAERLAAEGYVAMAADVYGKGVRPASTEEAGGQATIYRSDRSLMRARVQAGIDRLRSVAAVDESRVAAIGFCFGGGCVLELARSGSEISGVVSFHGNLDTPDPADANNIKGSVLVCHGADDPYVPAETVTAFQEEMRNAGVDWQMVAYGNSVHSFTHESAGTDNSKGAAYNEKAAKRSWQAMLDFFDEIFAN
ncbi:MAG: dienelactone hydrolase family protein [Planctomycetales bacterium]|nr:dienelactone hydrolase family protein [bacterium]UNM09720.1 MAG: dienelactone hydrolase family protein [Planctomycetales bacterium]